MRQTAIFVDAGYLHAQGSALIAGQKQARPQIILDVPKTLQQLCSLSNSCSPGARLLRTYWYDGLPRSGRMTSEQEQMAGAAYTKLRLGVVNSRGEQKGVDSLVVTDLIDLARNRAITDALLVSGDEDIRIGVQIAQTFGVQIHLLGIKPARGSQSPDLIQEADTHHEWNEVIVNEIMTIREIAPDDLSLPIVGLNSKTAPFPVKVNEFVEAIDIAVDDTLDHIDQAVLDSAVKAFKANPTIVPFELDRPTLGRLKSLLGRDLTDDERKDFRVRLRAKLQKF
jgi:uncharacterized LabA/DUF88 family protein